MEGRPNPQIMEHISLACPVLPVSRASCSIFHTQCSNRASCSLVYVSHVRVGSARLS
jgi:hypothetical protein